MSPSQNEARDPVFLEELRALIRQGKLPVQPPEKVIYRKRVRVNDRRAFVYSICVHGVVVVIALMRVLFPNLFLSESEIQARFKMLETQNAIRVDVVGLPSLTRKELEKIDLTQEPTKNAEAKAAKEDDESPIPSKNAMVLPDKMQKQIALDKKEKERAEKLKSARAALKNDLKLEGRRRALMDKLKTGGEGGRATVEGNILSKGYSASGTVATEMDAYQGKLKGHIRRFWDVPSWMNASSLKARVWVRLSAEGRIMHREFLAKSGNEEFDRYVEQTIVAAEPFPAPPNLLRQVMLEEGVEWGFPQ